MNTQEKAKWLVDKANRVYESCRSRNQYETALKWLRLAVRRTEEGSQPNLELYSLMRRARRARYYQ